MRKRGRRSVRSAAPGAFLAKIALSSIMFTGIVEEVGAVESASGDRDVLRVRIRAPRASPGLRAGDSIAVNGCCLTVETPGEKAFGCALTAETLRCTAFEARLRPGARVNIERPMRADGRFDGHMVQGHVDAVGTIASLDRTGEAAELVIAVPPSIERYLALKGSVAVDGISLTVASLHAGHLGVSVIPYTLTNTNLSDARPGEAVNIEADVVAKYVERLMAWPQPRDEGR